MIRILYFLLLLNSSCLSQQQGGLSRIKMTWVMPLHIDENNKPDSQVISIYVSTIGKTKIYELPYHVTQEINDVLIYDSVKYDYFIFNVDSAYGFLLKKITDSLSIKLPKDSMLKRSFVPGNNFAKDLSEKSLLSRKEFSDGSGRFSLKYLMNDNFNDSAEFFFDKRLNNISNSWDTSLDLMHHAKLYKIFFYIKRPEIHRKYYDFYINKFEMEEITDFDKPMLMHLADRFNVHTGKAVP